MSSIFAQKSFERLYEDDFSVFEYIAIDIATIPDGNMYIFSAVKHKDSTGFKIVNLTGLDNKGDYNFSRDYAIADLLITPPDTITSPPDTTMITKTYIVPEGSMTTVHGGLVMSFTAFNGDSPSHIFFKTDFMGRQFPGKTWIKAMGDTMVANVANERNRIDYNDPMKTLYHYGSSTNNGDPDLYINYYDSSATMINSRRYNYPTNNGSTFTEQFGGMQPTIHDGGYVFCGMKDTLISDFFVSKIDTFGNDEWVYTYTLDSVKHQQGSAVDVVEMNDSTYIAAFNLIDTTGNKKAYLIGIDSLGQSIWTKALSYSDGGCQISHLVKAEDNSVAIVLKKSNMDTSRIMMAGFDLLGDKIWEKIYKESYDSIPYYGGLIKTSYQKLAFVTTGYNTDDSKASPLRYVIQANLDGTTQCNQDIDELIIDSTGVYQDTFLWEKVTNIEPLSERIVSVGRQFTPYIAKPENGKYFYCPEDTINVLLLGETEGGVEYLWGSGETTDTLRVFDIGEYTIEVTVEDKYCHSFCDTITLSHYDPPTASLGVDFDKWCSERKIKVYLKSIFAAAGVASKEWSNGETEKFEIWIDSIGTYSVVVTDNCNQTSEVSIIITEDMLPKPNTIILEVVDNWCSSGKYGVKINNPAVVDITTTVWTIDGVQIASGTSSVNDVDVELGSSVTVMVTATDTCMYEGSNSITIANDNQPSSINLVIQDNWCDLGNSIISVSNIDDIDISSLVWSNGETGVESIIVTEAGTYSVTGQDICHFDVNSSIEIIEPLIEEILFNQEDEDYCKSNGLVHVSIRNANVFNSFNWSNGASTDTTSVAPGTYTVTVTDKCNNTISSEIVVAKPEIDCPGPLAFPNAFIPNESAEDFEINRKFGPVVKNENVDIVNYQMVIVNRWGQIVFDSDDYTDGWNGRFNDKIALGGTYFFKANYTTDLQSYEVKGGLELIK